MFACSRDSQRISCLPTSWFFSPSFFLFFCCVFLFFSLYPSRHHNFGGYARKHDVREPLQIFRIQVSATACLLGAHCLLKLEEDKESEILYYFEREIAMNHTTLQISAALGVLSSVFNAWIQVPVMRACWGDRSGCSSFGLLKHSNHVLFHFCCVDFHTRIHILFSYCWYQASYCTVRRLLQYKRKYGQSGRCWL